MRSINVPVKQLGTILFFIAVFAQSLSSEASDSTITYELEVEPQPFAHIPAWEYRYNKHGSYGIEGYSSEAALIAAVGGHYVSHPFCGSTVVSPSGGWQGDEWDADVTRYERKNNTVDWVTRTCPYGADC